MIKQAAKKPLSTDSGSGNYFIPLQNSGTAELTEHATIEISQSMPANPQG